MNYTGCHVPPLQGSDVPSNRRYMFTMITCRCFQTSIYSLQNFSDILLILPPLEFLQIFHHHYHGDCRILADGMRIFNLECCYCFTTILDRRSQPSYPQHSLRTCLHHLLLRDPPATCYANNLKMSYLDVLLLH